MKRTNKFKVLKPFDGLRYGVYTFYEVGDIFEAGNDVIGPYFEATVPVSPRILKVADYVHLYYDYPELKDTNVDLVIVYIGGGIVKLSDDFTYSLDTGMGHYFAKGMHISAADLKAIKTGLEGNS